MKAVEGARSHCKRPGMGSVTRAKTAMSHWWAIGASLFAIGLPITALLAGASETAEAQSKQRAVSESLVSTPSASTSAWLKLPFTAQSGGWKVIAGYWHGDHSTIPGTIYGLDLVVNVGSTAGQIVVSPVSGTIQGSPYPCSANGGGDGGSGVTIAVDGRTDQGKQVYVQLCHIAGSIPTGKTYQGQPLGTVSNDLANSHIHVAVFRATTATTGREAIPLDQDYAGGDYSLDGYSFPAPVSVIDNYWKCTGTGFQCDLRSSQMALQSPAPSVDVTLVIDSSGSMDWNDPQDKRKNAAKTYLTASLDGDYVGVVDFDDGVRTASPLQRLRDNQSQIAAAVDTIDSAGGTNIGQGILRACELLANSPSSNSKKAAILLTDGKDEPPYSDTAYTCFADRGWPIYVFGLGSDIDTTFLSTVASATGGQFSVLPTTNLVCEFQRVRALVAGVTPPPCTVFTVFPGQSASTTVNVATNQLQTTFGTSWLSGDVSLSLMSPSGRMITRTTVAADVQHLLGPSYESYSIVNPEAGQWQVFMYGQNVSSSGEATVLSVSSIPAPPKPDLRPFTPTGYPGPIAVSGRPGSTQNETLSAGAPTYFDWHFTNSGAGAAGAFYVELWVDSTRYVRYPFDGLNGGSPLGGFDDWLETIPTQGVHTVRLVVDPDNAVEESDESNNIFEQQFTWGPPWPTSCSGGQYLAQYYDNATLAGSPTFVDCEAAPLANEWQSAAPAGKNVEADLFSVRWTGSFTFAAGDYQFDAFLDDGMRVWIDGVLVLDEWTAPQSISRSFSRSMTAGTHEVKVEYFENLGYASASLDWHATAPPNDSSAGSKHITTVPYSDTLATSAATLAADDPSFDGVPGCAVTGQRYKSVWYEFTSFQEGILSVDTEGSDYDTVVGLWKNLNPGWIGWKCDDDSGTGTTSRLSYNVIPGVSYLIEVASFNDDGGHLMLNASFETCFELEVASSPLSGGSVEATPAADCLSVGSPNLYTEDTLVTLTAHPAPGFAFNGWSGSSLGSTNPLTVTVDSPKLVTANFVPVATSCPIGQYLAEYYGNTTLSGTPTFVGCEAGPLANEWLGDAPEGKGVSGDLFSVRWIGNFTFASGTYSFTAFLDDGMRVWIDGVLVLDEWRDPQRINRDFMLPMTAGTHEVKVEYYESAGFASAWLDWTAIPTTNWYFAEGFTGSGWNTSLHLLNANGISANVQVVYLLDSGSPVSYDFVVGPQRAFVIDANDPATGPGPNAAFGVHITSDVPIVAEEQMYAGVSGDFAHGTQGATGLSNSWYFAEGFTQFGWQTFVLVANPGASSADVTVTYQVQGGAAMVKSHTVAPGQRWTFAGHVDVPEEAFSVSISSTQPIVAELAMYEPASGIAHRAIGVTQPATNWYLGEGFTGAGWQTFISVGNPGNNDATVTAVYTIDGSPPVTKQITVPARSRGTFIAHDSGLATGPGPNVAFGVHVSSTQPIVVQEVLIDPAAGAARANSTMAASALNPRWSFSGGSSADGTVSFYTVSNPNASALSVSATYYFDDATAPVVQTISIPANSRGTFATLGGTPTIPAKTAVGVIITATGGAVVAQEAVYDEAAGRAYSSAGAPG